MSPLDFKVYIFSIEQQGAEVVFTWQDSSYKEKTFTHALSSSESPREDLDVVEHSDEQTFDDKAWNTEDEKYDGYAWTYKH